MSVMVYTGATFVKKNSCLVARIVLFDALKLWNSISFNSYVYYLTCGFIALHRVFNLLTRAFSLLTRGFELVTQGFELVTRGFEDITRKFELVTCGFEPITLGFELVSREFEFITRNSCLTFHNLSK